MVELEGSGEAGWIWTREEKSSRSSDGRGDGSKSGGDDSVVHARSLHRSELFEKPRLPNLEGIDLGDDVSELPGQFCPVRLMIGPGADALEFTGRLALRSGADHRVDLQLRTPIHFLQLGNYKPLSFEIEKKRSGRSLRNPRLFEGYSIGRAPLEDCKNLVSSAQRTFPSGPITLPR